MSHKIKPGYLVTHLLVQPATQAVHFVKPNLSQDDNIHGLAYTMRLEDGNLTGGLTLNATLDLISFLLKSIDNAIDFHEHLLNDQL